MLTVNGAPGRAAAANHPSCPAAPSQCRAGVAELDKNFALPSGTTCTILYGCTVNVTALVGLQARHRAHRWSLADEGARRRGVKFTGSGSRLDRFAAKLVSGVWRDTLGSSEQCHLDLHLAATVWLLAGEKQGGMRLLR